MNSHQLKCFIQVAETLNFARAAEILNLSQPAVSRQIISLEAELGVSLFQRTTRSVTLTSYGRAFLLDARHILNYMIAAAAKIHHNPDTSVATLPLGCSNSSDLDFFTVIFAKCRQQFPELHPFLRIMPPKRLVNMLEEGSLEAVFGFKEDVYESAKVKYTHLFFADICCAVRAAHPFASRPSVSLGSLYEENFVICNTSAFPSAVANIQKELEYRIHPSRTYYCDDVPVALSLIRAGYGFSLMPDQQSGRTAGIAYIPIEDYQPLSYGVYCRKDGRRNPLLRDFLSILQG